MKSVILIAAPAAGKGTEAAYLKEQYNMPHISTGNMLREKAQEDSDLGRDINYKINIFRFMVHFFLVSFFWYLGRLVFLF